MVAGLRAGLAGLHHRKGMRKHSFRKLESESRIRRRQGRLQGCVWLFSIKILKGVGKKVRFLMDGYYRIMARQKTVPF